MFQLKLITAESIARAMAKAERYRLLNEPREAESICLDILAIDPHYQPAMTCLLLSLTDQFGGGVQLVDQAKQILPRLAGAYEQAYYAGLISERAAKQYLERGHPGAGFGAYEYLVEAMKLYNKAEALAPKGNDDALLRHNACVRTIQRYRLEAPHKDGRELPLE
jgi:hypothetical protein